MDIDLVQGLQGLLLRHPVRLQFLNHQDLLRQQLVFPGLLWILRVWRWVFTSIWWSFQKGTPVATLRTAANSLNLVNSAI